MNKKIIPNGTVHKTPEDLKTKLISDTKMLNAWGSITPLARNEWICWVTSPKKTETRIHRIKRTQEELLEGKKRPCCWAGCGHR